MSITAHINPVACAAFSHRGNLLATASNKVLPVLLYNSENMCQCFLFQPITELSSFTTGCTIRREQRAF